MAYGFLIWCAINAGRFLDWAKWPVRDEMQEDDLERIKKHELFKRKTYHKNSISYINNNKKNEIGVELNLKDFKSLKSIIKKLDYTIKVTDRVTLANLTKKDLPRKAYRNLIINEINMLKRL